MKGDKKRMVFYVSGWREEDLLQTALAKYFAECTNPDEKARLAKMLARALECREKQGKRKSHG